MAISHFRLDRNCGAGIITSVASLRYTRDSQGLLATGTSYTAGTTPTVQYTYDPTPR